MKSRTLSLILLALLCAASACKPRKAVDGQPPEPPTVVSPAEPQVSPCGSALTRGPAQESAMIGGLTHSVQGDCIEMKVSYSGGCAEHRFELVWDGNWAESMPPQVSLRLVHHNNNDHCRAIKSEKLTFDIKPLRYSGVGQVILNLNAEGVPLQRANYTY